MLFDGVPERPTVNSGNYRLFRKVDVFPKKRRPVWKVIGLSESYHALRSEWQPSELTIRPDLPLGTLREDLHPSQHHHHLPGCVGGHLLPNHVGCGVLRFSDIFFACTFANYVHSYALFCVLAGIFLPLSISFVCYLKIYLKVKDSRLNRNRILQGKTDTQEDTEGPLPETSSNALAKSTVAYLAKQPHGRPGILRGPQNMLLIMLHLPATEIGYVWYILVLLSAHGNNAINCLIYAATINHSRAQTSAGNEPWRIPQPLSRHRPSRMKRGFLMTKASFRVAVLKNLALLDAPKVEDTSVTRNGSCNTAETALGRGRRLLPEFRRKNWLAVCLG
ncbi:hypothetical protein BV898_14534 [Hypsibius exemplaris]|uniref:G-protein coupled receptors family 1 profile domain-containing protein n=1 Tax=Hypsibius exemplaris TaxID=2072580 RepID=A0A9X6NCB5_HYPEX|nr:hypothetical protein BV898_14534 [Hypsibius exemplaris]